MPNIVLSSGEKCYKPLTETVDGILKELSNSTSSAEALVFNGKKLTSTTILSDIPHLADKHNIYVIEKPFKTTCPALNSADLKKYRRIFDELTDEEQNLARDYFCNPENITSILTENPSIRNDQMGLDILSDFTLLTNFVYKQENFITKRPFLFSAFKKTLDSVLAERAKTGNLNAFSQPSSSRNQLLNQAFAAQPASTSATPITSQMLQHALDMIGGISSNNSSTASVPSAASSTPSQNSAASVALPSTNFQQSMAMEVEPNYAQLRQTYSAQLQQMREFGFTDDEENIRALQACDGVVEPALELVIAIRESAQ